MYAGRAVLPSGAARRREHRRRADLHAADRGPTLRIEAFLLDHDGGDIYGQTMRIDFIERLRDERRFESVDALMEQVHEDIGRTRELAARPPGEPAA